MLYGSPHVRTYVLTHVLTCLRTHVHARVRTCVLTYLPPALKVLVKFYEKFVEGKKSEYIDDDGNVIKTPGAQYEDNGVRRLY